MAIVYLRISKTTKRVDHLKNGSPIVALQQYLIAEENEITLDNQSGYKGEFLDSFEYQVSEDGTLWSNPAKVNIKDLVGENTPAFTTTNDFVAIENNSYNVASEDMLDINSSTDRLRIVSIEGPAKIQNNGNAVNVNSEFYWHEFEVLDIITENGGGDPYTRIGFYCGNHLGYNENTVFYININIASLAEIAQLSENSSSDTVEISSVTYNRYYYNELIQITKAFVNKPATVEVVLNSPMFALSSNNSVIFRYNGQELVKNANETFNIEVLANAQGVVTIEVEHIYVNSTSANSSSSATFTITEIDGNASNISVNDSYNSTNSFNP